MSLQMTETAVSKVREVLETQNPQPAGLRIGVMGGGCSGFQYQMVLRFHQHLTIFLQNLNTLAIS